MIQGHLTGERVDSDFSSWAACVSIAKQNATATSYIAVLDTAFLASHVAVYHVRAFYEASLVSSPYDHEYLAYGPIEGPALHCGTYKNIVLGSKRLSLKACSNFYLFPLQLLTYLQYVYHSFVTCPPP